MFLPGKPDDPLLPNSNAQIIPATFQAVISMDPTTNRASCIQIQIILEKIFQYYVSYAFSIISTRFAMVSCGAVVKRLNPAKQGS